MSEYSSSFIDLEDHPSLEIGVRTETSYPENCVKPTTRNWRLGAREQPAYYKKLQTVRVRSLEGYLERKGPQLILEFSLV